MRRPRDKIQCDGLFLLFDTAAHVKADVTYAEAREHVDSCEHCQRFGKSHSDADWHVAGYKSWLQGEER